MVGNEKAKVLLRKINQISVNRETHTVKYTHKSIDDDAKIVDKILSIEEIVGREQEVPG